MSRKKNSTLLAAAAVAIAAALWTAPAAAQGAQDPGLYLGLGGSNSNFEGENGADVDSNAVIGRIGIQTLPWLSFEADAHFGVDDGSFDFQADEEDFDLDDNSDGDIADVITGTGDFQLDYLIGAYARASLPISPQFEVAARVGYAFAEVSSSVTTPGGTTLDLDESESGPSYGVGAAWYFTENQAARVDYTLTDFDDSEVDSWALTYQLKF